MQPDQPQNQSPNVQGQPVSITTGSSGGSRKKIIIGLIAVITLVVGVVAGVLLVQQQQDFRSRAGGDCSGIDNPNVTSPIFIPEGCSVSGTRFKGEAPSGASSDGDCVGFSENSSGFSATGPTTISLNPSCGECEQVDFEANGQSYGTAKYGGDCELLCDDSCTSDSDCADVSPAGAPIECNEELGLCVNKLCPNDTIPGNNCSCETPTQGCGEPCGGAYPLCGEGYQCRYITGSSCTRSSQNNPTTFCIPHPPPEGYSVPKCVARDTGNSYVNRDSDVKSTWTQEEIVQEFCQAPQATEEPVAISAQCLNIRAFDTEWNELTVSDLEKLEPGDTVRFAAAGSANAGSFTAARFTINGNLRQQVVDKRPGGEEFYDEYTISEEDTGLNVSVEIQHSELGWF